MRAIPETGQSKVEYALLLALVALAVTAVLLLFGPFISQAYLQAASNLPAGQEQAEQAPFLGIMQDFLSRIRAFYDANGHWPRSWGTYRFTDLGLDPADWSGPVEGIFWNPNGDKLGLANRSGDDLQVYVNDLEGNTLHLYDGWNIWCAAGSGQCYYHTVAPGNEVDISTLVVVTE